MLLAALGALLVPNIVVARRNFERGVSSHELGQGVIPTPTPTATPPPPTSTATRTATRTGTRTATSTATATRTPTPNLVVIVPFEGQVVGVEGVSFAWTAVGSATGYDLRVLNAATQAVIFTGTLNGAGATSTLISLPSNGSYTFRVRACVGAVSDATCGGFASRNFSVILVAPSAAPTVTFPAPGAMLTTSQQTLQWTAVAPNPALSTLLYEVRLLDRVSGLTELQVRTFDPVVQTQATLRSGQYRLQVRACQAGCGPFSAAVDFSVALGAVPTAAPTVTSAVVNGGNNLSTSWTSVAGAEWYQVQVVQTMAGPGGGALTVAARQVTGTSVMLPVPVGQAYVIVAGCNGDGCGPYSAGVLITPAGPNPLAPQVGAPLDGSVVQGPGVIFAWSRIPGDTGSNVVYRLYVQDLSRQTAALDVRTTQNFFGALLKAEGAKYAVLVIANPGLANEVQGPGVAFTVRGSSAVAPTLMAPTYNSTLPAGNIVVGWTPVPGATLYEYYVAVQGVAAATGRGVTPGVVVQVPLGAVNGQPTVYSGIVRACPAGQMCASGSDAGWGPWSDVAGTGNVSFTVVPAPPALGGSSLRFNGNGNGDIDRAKIALDAPNRPVDVGGDFTIEFWMKTASGNASGSCSAGNDAWMNGNTIFDRDVFGAGDNGDYGIALFGSGGTIGFGVDRAGTGNTICGTHNVADGTWHHIAVTRRNADGELRLFADGQLDAVGGGPSGDVSYRNGRATAHPNSDPFLVIGAEKHDTGPAFPSYHGWIDEVRISSVLRYESSFTPPVAPFATDGNTAALYHFDEDNGNTVVDSAGAVGGPSNGVRRLGGAPAGPQWSTDTPFAAPAPQIALDTLTSALNSPTSITNAGDQRLFITQMGGQILIWDGAQILGTPFLTVTPISSGGERGLLSVAFHPNYPQNGFFYVYYTDTSGNPTIARYHVSANPNVADPTSGKVMLTVPHPGQSNHNGGQLQFGPDGFLYAGLGDGGSGCDQSGSGCNAQRDNLYLGKLLRLDVNQNVNAAPYYGIPAGNPFAPPNDPTGQVLDEIWAKGVRNPWRFSFDKLTGSLFIGDVGQDTREEVDVQPAGSPGGQNYGWKRMEGFLCDTCSVSDCPVAPPPCNDPSLTLPVLDYDHSLGCAITGGYVYRGTQVPGLYGKYLFGDLCSGRLWWANDNNGTWSNTQFAPTAGQLWTWGQDVNGELYLGLGSGQLMRVRAGP
jgi:glucose/arabinose dehydrogenase